METDFLDAIIPTIFFSKLHMSRKKVFEQYLMGHTYYGTVHIP